MLHNGNETVCTGGRVNLYFGIIVSCTPEFLDFEVLFDPLEEQLYLPMAFVEVGSLQWCQLHCISQKHELTTLLPIEKTV